MIPVATRHRIQVLIEAGQSMASIAESVGVSVRSVKRIAKERNHAKDDASERRLRGIGRPSITREYGILIRNCLIQDPKARANVIIRLAREAGYGGGDSAMYALVKRLRNEIRPVEVSWAEPRTGGDLHPTIDELRAEAPTASQADWSRSRP